MNALQTEQNRLYRAHQDTAADSTLDATLIAPDASVRALVLELGRPADWSALAPVWQGVQADLGLPAPAIAVSGLDAQQLWFSLAQAVPAAQGLAFLEGLRQRYLADLPAKRVTLWPQADAAQPTGWRHATAVPAPQAGSGMWSAYVAPDLAAIFSDEPWLERAPSPEAQAKVLATMSSIQPSQWQAARAAIAPPDRPVAAAVSEAQTALQSPTGAGNREARAFLRSVMNDPAMAMRWRMEAARALLPYEAD